MGSRHVAFDALPGIKIEKHENVVQVIAFGEQKLKTMEESGLTMMFPDYSSCGGKDWVFIFHFTTDTQASNFFYELNKVLERKKPKGNRVYIDIDFGKFIRYTEFCDKYKVH